MNWVRARSQCSLKHVFTILLAEVLDSDVKAANELKRPDLHFGLSRSDTKLVVTRKDDDAAATDQSIVFELSGTEINVREGAKKHLFSAKPSLNQGGECKLEIDGEPFELWQVSRKALEELFFG